jgi:hypothetical protein
LERAVSGYFDYIEDLIERENTFTMEEFAASVNEFLSFRKWTCLITRLVIKQVSQFLRFFVKIVKICLFLSGSCSITEVIEQL